MSKLPAMQTSAPVSPPEKPLDTAVAKYMIGGCLALVLLFGGFGGWAATTKIAGAVIATGYISVASSVKKVQHPTGGVVGDIRVQNGDHVHSGQLVMRLDETVTRANLQLITKQLDENMGRQARLRAERDDSSSVTFPDDFMARQNEQSIADIMQGERVVFETRRNSRVGQKSQLSERILQLRQEILGVETQTEAKGREVTLIARELDGLVGLEREKLVTTSKMNALRREGARLDGERAQLIAAAAQAKGRITETELQILNIDHQAKSETVKELREIDAKIGELVERRIAADDQLTRIDIRSPAEGIVHQLQVHTVGGVINPVDPVMLIVPEGDRLVVDAQIAPHDIDQARQHTNAMLRFPAFNQRTTPTIEARVTTIGADLIRDPQANTAYYGARLEINDDQLGRLDGLKLVPGMPVEVMMQTSERTALSYLIKPIEDQFARAFRER